MIIYVVKQGDTVYSISQMFGLNPQQIISDNMLLHPDDLVVGQTLVLLANQITITLNRNDRLTNIAKMFGLSVIDLFKANPKLAIPNSVQQGMQITIPLPNQNLGSMLVNGYAFPNINMDILQKTLPNLSFLSIFSYQVRPDGSLISIPDEPLIESAKQYNVAPLMVITNIEEDGGFSGEITNQLFANPEAKQNLINSVLTTVNQKGYYGVDVDFEYIFPEDRDNYSQFLRELTAVMHENGYIVTAAVAPKISDDMVGVLYEAHDYKAIGEIVDHVIIMTYEWGYTYGEPMAVSPLNNVKQVLDYAVTVIPREKILMGMPNYGYDWTLPYVPGTAARVVSNVGAVDLAREKGSFIKFDPKAATPYFYYWQQANGGGAYEHVVWFDDARSVDAKLKLVDIYGLGGVSYWTINRYFPQNWLVQNVLYDVQKVV